METVLLQPLLHRNTENIGIYFTKHAGIEQAVRKQAGAKWSQTHKCWYIPLQEKGYHALLHSLKPVADVNIAGLKSYLLKKQKVLQALPAPQQRAGSKPEIAAKPVAQTRAWELCAANLEALTLFVQRLQLKAYSPSTINTYRNEFMQLLTILQQKPVHSLTAEDLKRYMVFAMKEQHITENTAHSRLNALKFYFEQVLGQAKFFFDIPRPKKQDLLPKVFSQEDVALIIKSMQNLKHKVMLMLAYSAGMRVSEVVSIKTFAIDSNRMTIFISQAKGKKDRIATLSPVLLVMLREYAKQYKPDKRGYLFSGVQKGTPYSPRSLQLVMQAAKQKAGIIRPGSIHSLRHSFATHLVERGKTW